MANESVKFYRGNKVNLPLKGENGTIYIAEDSGDMYMDTQTTSSNASNGESVAGRVRIKDSSKAPINHASSGTSYGVSTASNYGHAKASTTVPKANGTASVGTETSSFARGDHVHPLQTSVANATKATQDSAGQKIDSTYIKGLSVSGRTITYTKGDGSTGTISTQDTNTTYSAATSSQMGLVKSGGDITVDASGVVSVANDSHTHSNATITSLDASKLTGTISIDRLPKGSLERLVPVEDQAARFSLTTNEVQLGDTVHQLDTGVMYLVVDEAELDNAAGYKEYTAGSATSVPWSGVTGRPSTFTPSTHTHTISQVTDIANASVAAATKATQDSAGQAINSTYIKALSASGRTITYTKGNGTTGTITTQDTTYANATTGSAGLMSAADKTKLDGIATGANKYTHPTYAAHTSGLYKVTVDTTGHVSAVSTVTKSDITALGIPAQDTNTTYSAFKGATASAAGGSGLVPAPDAGDQNLFLKANGTWAAPPTATLSSLGVTATAAELNFMDGVTSNVQTQLNGKAASSHNHTKSQITDFPTSMKNPSAITFTGASTGTYDGSSALTINIPTSGAVDESLVIKLNGGTTEGTNMFTFNGSAAKSVNITAASVGAAASSHNHSAANITSGTLPVARGGTGLSASPSILVNLASTSTASVFTTSPRPGVTGTLPIANGGTGATSASAARTALGITPANIGAAATSHTHSTYLPLTGGTLSGLLTPNGGLAHCGTTHYLAFPGGGLYTTQTSSVTGFCKIVLPVSWNSTMLKFKVSIFDYVNNCSVDYIISGYNFSSNDQSAWTQCTAICLGKPGMPLSNLPVIFGHDGTHCVIAIGSSSTVWAYPQVAISDVLLGFAGGNSYGTWSKGWSIVFNTTAISNIDRTIENTNVAYGSTPGDHNHSAADITSGTLPVARGGTGVTASPSMLVNLGSTSAAGIFTSAPRPGITGTLPIANGGTGATSASAARTALGITPANIGAAASSHTHAVSQVTGLTASRALVSDASGHPAVSAVTSTELGYLDGVTSSIQTQLNGKAASSHSHSDMKGSTSSAAGSAGFVPAPAAGKQTSFLRGDGTWVVPTNTNTTYTLTKSGSTITLTGSDGSKTSVTDADTNTTYSAATTSTNGLMTAAMVTKLNGIAEGANKYTLPAATASVMGGVKVGSNITVSSGTISLTKANVVAALGYTPPTTDTNTDTKVTNTVNNSTKYYVTGSTSASTNTGTQIFDTGVYVEATAGRLHSTSHTIGSSSEYALLSYDSARDALKITFA
mgnify:CR=1 FL=1